MSFFFFRMPLDVFSTALHIRLGISHPLVLGVSHCIFNQPLNPTRIHLLHCAHGGERMALHDAFGAIVENARFHVSQEQSHVLPPLALQFLPCQVNILLSINGVHMLADVVIVDPTWIDLVSQATFSCGVVTRVTTWVKDGFYCDQFLEDMFFPLVIKVFGFLHQ